MLIKRATVAQWFRALAAMAMSSVRAWVQVPPMTCGVFANTKVSPLNN